MYCALSCTKNHNDIDIGNIDLRIYHRQLLDGFNCHIRIRGKTNVHLCDKLWTLL